MMEPGTPRGSPRSPVSSASSQTVVAATEAPTNRTRDQRREHEPLQLFSLLAAAPSEPNHERRDRSPTATGRGGTRSGTARRRGSTCGRRVHERRIGVGPAEPSGLRIPATKVEAMAAPASHAAGRPPGREPAVGEQQDQERRDRHPGGEPRPLVDPSAALAPGGIGSRVGRLRGRPTPAPTAPPRARSPGTASRSSSGVAGRR